MYTNKSNLYIAYLFFVWFLFPFFSIFLVLFFISQVQLHIRQYNFLFFLMSMSFALLAYTQVSLAAMDTDIVRYYNSYQFMVGSSFSLNSYLIFEDWRYPLYERESFLGLFYIVIWSHIIYSSNWNYKKCCCFCTFLLFVCMLFGKRESDENLYSVFYRSRDS